MVLKNPNWEEVTPVDQLTVVRWSLENHARSMAYGFISERAFIRRVFEYLEEIEQLEHFLRGEENW